MFFGLFVISYSGLQGYQGDSGSAKYPNMSFGIILMVFQMSIDSIYYIGQEKLFSIYYMSSDFLVGWSGIWGFLFMLPLVFAMNQVPCDYEKDKFCSGHYIEDTTLWYNQILSSAQLKVALLGYLFTKQVYAIASTTLVKETGALTRTLFKQLQPIMVWAFSYYFGWEKFIWMQFIGFVFIVLGNLIYNKIIFSKTGRSVQDQFLFKFNSVMMMDERFKDSTTTWPRRVSYR